jgi:ABC-2 type transport system permease protein/capsular polysaccharide transport system permease protein
MSGALKGFDQQSLGQSWAIQRRVVGALLMREILTRYGRHNIGFLWLFVEPMLFTLGVTALWTFVQAGHGSSLPIVAFALTGYSSVLLWRNMPARCISAIEPNLSLLYHRYVKLIDIYYARLALEAMGATISFVVLALLFISIEWLEPPEDVLKVAAGWAMLAWFGSALAIFLGTLAYDNELVEKIWHPASYLLFPLSGAGFLVDALPKAAQDFLLYIPMVHGVELLREGYFGSAIRAHYDMVYMAEVTAVLTLIGLFRVRALGRRVIPS